MCKCEKDSRHSKTFNFFNVIILTVDDIFSAFMVLKRKVIELIEDVT